MRKNSFYTILIICLLGVLAPAVAQELHCNRAIKKQDKSEKKESKIQKKMFRDRPFKAARKLAKSEKKEDKVEDKEFIHSINPAHDKPRANF